MNKKGKINIFILTIFLIISSIISAHFSPEKEIKTIQTLPRKPQATLDIEVTKVKSQEITGQIDEKNKVITVDFSEILNSRKNKMNIDKSQYEVYPIENLESLHAPKSKFMRSNFNQNKFQVTKTDTSININYENKPEKLYLGVFNKNTSDVEKVFKLNLEKNILPRDSIAKTYTLTNPIFIRSGNTGANVEGISNTQGIYRFGLTANGTFYAQGTTSYGYFVDTPFAASALQGLSIYAGTGGNDNQAVSSTLNASSGGQSSTVFIYFPSKAVNRDWNKFAVYNNNTSGLVSGNSRINTSLLRYLNGDGSTVIRFVVFGAWGQSTYRAGFEILKWNLEAISLNFKNIYTHDITWNINIPALDIKSYYDNSATIQSTGSAISKSGTFLEFRDGIKLGTVKLKDGSVLPNLATDPHGGIRFVGNGSVTLSNGTKTMNGKIYTIPVGTDTTGINSNPYFSGTTTRPALDVYFKLNNTTTLETGLAYASSSSRLLKLEVVNKPSFLTELITSLNLTINRIDKAATITLKNPIPKRNGTTSGYYNLTGATNPSGMSTNQNTLSWTGSPISTDYGYSLYNFIHKVVVRFTDGVNVGRVVFDTDANGKISGTTKYQTVSVGGNTYAIGDFGDGKFSLGMDQWNFANKTGVKIDVLHYDVSYTTPTSATDTQAFAKDTFTLNINALTPETYYKVNGSDSSLIVKGGSKTLNIPKVSNPSILIGKVQLINDDKTITIDTNSTPTNPNGVTFATTGSVLTFSNGTNTVTGTVSIDSSPTSDTTGRNLYLNLTSGVIPSGTNNYTLNNATLIKLGIKSTTSNPANPSDIYYNLVNNLTLVPGGLTFDKSSSFTFKNPIPKGLTDGTGSYILNGTTNPKGLLTNQNTLVWGTNNTASTGMTLSPTVHKVGVWITDGGTTQKASFTTDATGKLSGTKTGTITVGGNTYIFGDFNSDGNFSLGLQSWNFTNKSGVTVKILHFDNSLDPLTASEAQAFGRDQFTMSIDALTPETYYKVDANDSELIVKDGVQTLIIPRSGPRKISLGKVKVKNNSEVEKAILTNFTFYQTGENLIFTGTDSTTINGIIELSPGGTDEAGQELILNITSGTPTPGITYSATPILIKLGTNDSGGIYYNLRNTLNLKLSDSFIADYSVADLDFGAAIANNEAYNEAKTTLNLTLADDIINPSLVYAIKTSPTTTNNYYTDFKLHPNGVETAGDFVTTDIWLGNEVKDTNNTQKRSIDINGKVKDISNANVTTSSIPYQNTVELIIKIQ